MWFVYCLMLSTFIHINFIECTINTHLNGSCIIGAKPQNCCDCLTGYQKNPTTGKCGKYYQEYECIKFIIDVKYQVHNRCNTCLETWPAKTCFWAELGKPMKYLSLENFWLCNSNLSPAWAPVAVIQDAVVCMHACCCGSVGGVFDNVSSSVADAGFLEGGFHYNRSVRKILEATPIFD